VKLTSRDKGPRSRSALRNKKAGILQLYYAATVHYFSPTICLVTSSGENRGELLCGWAAFLL
jgi:hypothetical protein